MTRAAIVQLISSSSVQSNLNTLVAHFTTAQTLGAKLIVLPENFALMALPGSRLQSASETYGEGIIQQTVSNLARQFKMWVVAGTMPLNGSGSRVKSSCLVYDEEGIVAARYDKIHLFDVRVSVDESHQESRDIEPGERPVVVDTPIGRVGLSVCYDVRFPELYRILTQQGAEIFAVPAAFTALTGAAHWEVLLRARAIENLAYVIAANQGGLHENGRQTYGHSCIIEPWGSLVVESDGSEAVVAADIDLQRLRQLRLQFPCNEHHVLMTEMG